MNLQPGTWLSCNGPYGGVGIVTAINGTLGTELSHHLGGGVTFLAKPGATVDVIYDDGRAAPGLRESFLNYPTPWRVLDREPASPAVIASFIADAAVYKAEEAAKADAASRAYAEAKAELPGRFPYLLLAKDVPGGSLIAAAKNIRTLLKRAFPEVKFSVKTERFSGGNALDVKWIDGPTSAEVNKITGRFSGGYFDGMNDCYNYQHSPWTDLFGEAKYVHTGRDHSRGALLAAVEKVIPEQFGDNPPSSESIADRFDNGELHNGNYWLCDAIKKALGYA